MAGAGAHPQAPAAGPTTCAAPCWVSLADVRAEGVVLGWQQDQQGTWWALVSAWLPQQAVTRRDAQGGG